MIRPSALFLYLCFLSLALVWLKPANGQVVNDSTHNLTLYKGAQPYPVQVFSENPKGKGPKNIILLIGDGMGVAHITAALVANGGALNLCNFRHTGLITTHPASGFITDSGAGGTALATGKKTYNGAIGVDMDTLPVSNIREILAARGKATGVISTSSVTHATPAAFVAHQPDRELHDAIALDFVRSGIDLFLGGGLQYFTGRSDSMDLVGQLEMAGYFVDTSTTGNSPVLYFLHPEETGKVAGLYAKEHLRPVAAGRGNFLPSATADAITYLNRNKEGFFLMVEGSQIDWGGHDNSTSYVVSEMLDFDRAVGEALAFAALDRRTLVIVTADHETGGFAVHNGDYGTGSVTGHFTTDDHTGSMVPVFAFGPGAATFTGISDNTDIPTKILKLMKITGLGSRSGIGGL